MGIQKSKIGRGPHETSIKVENRVSAAGESRTLILIFLTNPVCRAVTFTVPLPFEVDARIFLDLIEIFYHEG